MDILQLHSRSHYSASVSIHQIMLAQVLLLLLTPMTKPSRPHQSRIMVTTPRCHGCSFPCNRTPLKHILSTGQVSPHECPRALAHLENSTPSMVSIPVRI